MTENEKYADKRIEAMLDVVMRVARGDYHAACAVGEKSDNFDALGMALNMMIEDIGQAQDALVESQENLAATLNSIGDGVIACTARGNISFMNPVAEILTGWNQQDAAGKPINEIFNIINEKTGQPAENPVEKVLKHGKIVGLANDTILIKRDGKRIPIDDSGAPIKNIDCDVIGVVLVFRDITDRKLLEQEKRLRQERLVQLGQLAGGVGHELRNPLGAIKNAVYFLNIALEETAPEIKETLTILDKEVATSERIISSLLDFACPKQPLKRKIDIKTIIEAALARLAIPHDIEVKYQPAAALIVMADPGQLDQVFGSIILNAFQAMPNGGQLRIETALILPDRLAISFTDTGVGITHENIPKIFTPLFTSKAKGIGLGLAISRTFVEGHGGSIEVQSEPGKGTTFTVQLPLREEKSSTAAGGKNE
jgi:PAS domain S-box-containing protein